MIKYLLLSLKGILFGASNLIPGASGGTTLVACGIYDETLESISTLRSNFKKSFFFLLFLLIGTIIGVVTGSLLIKKILLASIPFATYCMFAGFIVGTLPDLVKPCFKKFKYYYIFGFIISAAAVIGLLFLGNKINNKAIFFGQALEFKDYLLLFLCGFIGVFAMIIPGVSGILIFMILGYYNIFLDAINNIYHIHTFVDAFLVGLPVGLGMLVGIFPAALLMRFLMKKFPHGSYYCILGFVVGSIACLFISFFSNTYYRNSLDAKNIGLGILLLIIFAIISYILTTFKNKNKEEIKETTNTDEDSLRKEIIEELKQENIINENNELIVEREKVTNEDDDSFVAKKPLRCPYCNSKNFIEIEDSMYQCNSCKAKFESKEV